MSADFRKKKQYGQNFLTNSAIPRRIAAESGITEADGVIEIGPGFGILTRELCAIARKVVSVEIDGELTDILNQNRYKQAYYGRVRRYGRMRVRQSSVLHHVRYRHESA